MSQYAATMGATMQMIPIAGFMGFLIGLIYSNNCVAIHGVAVELAVVVAEENGLSVVGPLEAGGCCCGQFIELPAVGELVENRDVLAAATIEEINAVVACFKDFSVVVYYFHFALVFDWLISFLIVHTMRAEAPRV